MPTNRSLEEEWFQMLTQGENIPHHIRHLMRLLPSSPRCKLCNSPFKGWGGFLMHLMGRDQSRFNPRYCEPCERFEHPGGAEVVLTMLFADVRGSTSLAANMSALDFSKLINRYYVAATDVLVQADAMVDRLIGDEVVGLFFPGLAGQEHARRAIQAAQSLLRLTVTVIRMDHGFRLAWVSIPARHLSALSEGAKTARPISLPLAIT